MEIAILPVNAETLVEYSTISSRFEVGLRLVIELLYDGLGGIVFHEENVEPPYIKDYDRLKGEGTTRWPKRFNTDNWGMFIAREGGKPVGGAVAAFRTPEVYLLDAREDLVLLWDIRVQPERRRCGIGAALFAEVVRWSRERGCTRLKVETQNVNVPACRFYVRQGCKLAEIGRFHYAEPQVADEVMLIWYLDIKG
jgi:GNAT superfamily N-acetyltransferase